MSAVYLEFGWHGHPGNIPPMRKAPIFCAAGMVLVRVGVLVAVPANRRP